MDAIMQALLQHGVLGIVVALLVLWTWYKDKQNIIERAEHAKEVKAAAELLAAEQSARVADAQKFTGVALDLQAKAIDACSVLRDNVEEYKRLGDLVEKAITAMRGKNGG